MTKVNRIAIRRAYSGKQYLIFYVKSEESTEYDRTVILDESGYLEPIPTDIAETLELVKNIYIDLTINREF